MTKELWGEDGPGMPAQDEVKGQIFFDRGDESEFTAQRQEMPQATRPPQGRRTRRGP